MKPDGAVNEAQRQIAFADILPPYIPSDTPPSFPLPSLRHSSVPPSPTLHSQPPLPTPSSLFPSRPRPFSHSTPDIILLNKRDLVTEEEAEGVKERVREINPLAPLLPSTKSVVDLQQILDRKAFDPDPALIEPYLKYVLTFLSCLKWALYDKILGRGYGERVRGEGGR